MFLWEQGEKEEAKKKRKEKKMRDSEWTLKFFVLEEF